MSDVHSKETRSHNMSQIKGKNTKPEMLVRRFLFSKGFRYRLHSKGLPGKPDLVFPKHKTVIFIHGCFWHAHTNCRYSVIPKTRTDWWREKIIGNVNRDIEKSILLNQMGWRVLTIWECELKSSRKEETLNNLLKELITNERV
ncbi:very short patch repair endonuclease [Chitinophaga rhizophila]|uniref:Very short patch repair endonuclease n=1 Tax=Chitinophaga rhizophila TaxID=2866212 RepID=A0ABS7GBQ5_9BACT|nr:very short patch repair endonuclease [Chitinophaga rhizophila]MBW8684690.1 very short patch repair endonuclease [Chitinophaga rhizophila]